MLGWLKRLVAKSTIGKPDSRSSVMQVRMVRAKFDSAQTTPDNRRHWASADGLSADAAGDVVVQNNLVGVARTPIVANALGSLAVAGVFDVPKATGTGKAIAAGKTVYWDATNKVATETSSGNTLMGKTVAAAADADALVRVRLSQ